MIGLIFPPSLLATTALGATVGGMTGVLRGSAFDEADVKAMADELQPGQSMVIAIVEPQWQDEVEAALDGLATKIGWTVMSAATANALARQERVETCRSCAVSSGTDMAALTAPTPLPARRLRGGGIWRRCPELQGIFVNLPGERMLWRAPGSGRGDRESGGIMRQRRCRMI